MNSSVRKPRDACQPEGQGTAEPTRDLLQSAMTQARVALTRPRGLLGMVMLALPSVLASCGPDTSYVADPDAAYGTPDLRNLALTNEDGTLRLTDVGGSPNDISMSGTWYSVRPEGLSLGWTASLENRFGVVSIPLADGGEKLLVTDTSTDLTHTLYMWVPNGAVIGVMVRADSGERLDFTWTGVDTAVGSSCLWSPGCALDWIPSSLLSITNCWGGSLMDDYFDQLNNTCASSCASALALEAENEADIEGSPDWQVSIDSQCQAHCQCSEADAEQ